MWLEKKCHMPVESLLVLTVGKKGAITLQTKQSGRPLDKLIGKIAGVYPRKRKSNNF